MSRVLALSLSAVLAASCVSFGHGRMSNGMTRREFEASLAKDHEKYLAKEAEDQRLAEEKAAADEAEKQRQLAAFADALETRIKDRAKSFAVDTTYRAVNVDDWSIELDTSRLYPDSPGASDSCVVAWCAETKELVYWVKGDDKYGKYDKTRLGIGSGDALRRVRAYDVPHFLAEYGCEDWLETSRRLLALDKADDHRGYAALYGPMKFMKDDYLWMNTVEARGEAYARHKVVADAVAE